MQTFSDLTPPQQDNMCPYQQLLNTDMVKGKVHPNMKIQSEIDSFIKVRGTLVIMVTVLTSWLTLVIDGDL